MKKLLIVTLILLSLAFSISIGASKELPEEIPTVWTKLTYPGRDYCELMGSNSRGTHFVGFTNVGEDTVGVISTWTQDYYFFVPGSEATFCLGINNDIKVVGTYLDKNADYHGFIYIGATGDIYILDFPGAKDTICRYVTASGSVIGSCSIWDPLLNKYVIYGFLVE